MSISNHSYLIVVMSPGTDFGTDRERTVCAFDPCYNQHLATSISNVEDYKLQHAITYVCGLCLSNVPSETEPEGRPKGQSKGQNVAKRTKGQIAKTCTFRTLMTLL